MRHARVCVESDVLLSQSQLILQESHCPLTILVLDNGIGITVRLEDLQVLRGGRSERGNLRTQRQPCRKSSNTSNGIGVGETGKERNGATLAEATNDDALTWNLLAIQALCGTIVLCLYQLLDLISGLEEAGFIFSSREIVKCQDCR